jgi:hypothetical protein
VRIDSATTNIRSPSTSTGNHCRQSERRSIWSGKSYQVESDDSWPTALGIVPVSGLPAKSLQNRRQSPLFRPT